MSLSLAHADSAENTARAIPEVACAQCIKLAKYACPGCGIRTCSVPCSAAHKAATGCTGQRNRAAYVPLNTYGLGNLMDDYVYLEDVGRHVANWGRDIVRAKLYDPHAPVRGGRGSAMRGRGGRGRGRGGHTVGKAEARRLTLRRQLDLWDIDVELLPSGMAKAQLNKSSWDFKCVFSLTQVE
jgi:hypothetical protein